MKKTYLAIAFVGLVISLSGCGTAYALKAECMNDRVFNTVYARDYIFAPYNDVEKYVMQPQYIIMQGFTKIKCGEEK